VRNPLDKTEEAIADAYSGHDQGTLFFLLGSDSESLNSGNRALDNVIDRYSDHPLSVYAKLVKGINAGRAFKTVTEDKALVQRAPNTGDAIKSLTEVIEASTKADGKTEGVDNITLNMAIRRLARAQTREGDLDKAEKTLDYLVAYFKDQLNLKTHVVNQIARKTGELRQEVRKDAPEAAKAQNV
jgi:Asp-tRNA(Asn)/Glu-tRNA(Gln) amidotransferase C subunit